MYKEIINRNDKAQYHGYQQWFINNKPRLRGNFKNGNRIGYFEQYMGKRTLFYIK